MLECQTVPESPKALLPHICERSNLKEDPPEAPQETAEQRLFCPQHRCEHRQDHCQRIPQDSIDEQGERHEV
jgi:hypothetical protein